MEIIRVSWTDRWEDCSSSVQSCPPPPAYSLVGRREGGRDRAGCLPSGPGSAPSPLGGGWPEVCVRLGGRAGQAGRASPSPYGDCLPTAHLTTELQGVETTALQTAGEAGAAEQVKIPGHGLLEQQPKILKTNE